MKQKLNLEALRLRSFVTKIDSDAQVGGFTVTGCVSLSGCETSPVLCNIVVITEDCQTEFLC